jgi:hypothetical protein
MRAYPQPASRVRSGSESEPVPLLEHEQLDHYHFIDVRSAAPLTPVIEHIAHYRANKRFPIYRRFYLHQPITKPFHPLVRLIQAKIHKIFHYYGYVR